MADQQQYKCPNCGGAIAFDSSIQKMKCPYCDSEFDMQAVAHLDDALANAAPDEMNWQTQAGSEWGEGEADGLSTYTCNACGGEIVADANTAATQCPYCDNPVVLTGRVAGMLRPDAVIPFKLDKNAAKAALAQHLTGKKLLPKEFKDENHIDEVKGVYVPFWLFDADVSANIRYRATKTRRWSDSSYNYTEISHFDVERGGTVAFDLVPVDGSSQMPDDLMESVEPFDYRGGATQFQTAYLAGYLADKYDVTAEQSIDRANARVKLSTEAAFAATVTGYDSVQAKQSSVQIMNGRAQYALYPVWVLNTTWNNEKFLFAMNGQTGKFVGNLPCDEAAATRYTLLYTGIGTIVIIAILFVLWYAVDFSVGDIIDALLA